MKKRLFGDLNGQPVEEVVLENAHAAVSVISLGCRTRDWRVHSAAGTLPIILGFESVGDYVHHSKAHGAVVGRIANRTAQSSFELDGKTYCLSANDGPDSQHHLHGGTCGLADRVWEMEVDTAAEAVELRYHSPDGEEGYPGSVDFTVRYRLQGRKLICEMHGVPDRPTPINLAHHNYFNLAGAGDVRDHMLWVDAEFFTPVDDDLLPLGSFAEVADTRLDFRTPRTIEATDPSFEGLDHNFVLRDGRDARALAAWASCDRSGLKLEVVTDQPGMQIFNAAEMVIAAPGLEGRVYGRFSGLCFEAQHYPDSMHNPHWPSIIRTPEAPYFQRLEIGISQT
ncbi:MAG: aldose epimerase family protein [Pseudomonadota bacterium]